MDTKIIAELFQQLGFWGTVALLVVSFIGGVISHYVVKFFDTQLERESKTDEEIREIKRKRYEEFVEYIEKLLSRGSDESNKTYFSELNLIYSKMAISVPDEVVKIMTKEFDGYFDAKNRNRIYLAIRKDLLGKSNLDESDLKYWSPAKK